MYEKLELLPDDQLLIIGKLLENETIVKVLLNNTVIESPLLKPLPSDEKDIKNLFLSRIFPYPFSDDITEEQSQIRVYYPETEFVSGGHIEMTEISFDIIVHKNLILMKKEDGKTTIRTEFLGKEIISQFNEQSIGTIGKLQFMRRVHIPVSPEFQMIRLEARTMT